ncbi:MAG: tetratricopeptide repeat protein [Ammonifex sp.]|nr:MAG: tetratricopeptide repeat protein [Ammonifex sp.]
MVTYGITCGYYGYKPLSPNPVHSEQLNTEGPMDSGALHDELTQDFLFKYGKLTRKSEKRSFLAHLAEQAKNKNLESCLSFFLSHLQYLEGEYREAIRSCHEAVDTCGNAALPWFTLGCVYADRGLDEWETAADCFEKAIEISPDSPCLWESLGTAHRKLKDVPNAVKCYERAIELDPHYAAPWNGLGRVFFEANELEKAASCYERAMEIDPRYAQNWSDLGLLYAKTNKARAIEFYERAIELDPDDGHPYRNLGLLLLREGKYRQAKKQFEAALERFRNDPANSYLLPALEARIRSIHELTEVETDLKGSVAATEPTLRVIKETIDQGIEESVLENKKTLFEFIDEEGGCPNSGSYFQVLRKWNSYTPIIAENHYASKGGGYFARIRGKGIAIDPGFNFIDNFKAEQHAFRELDVILISHAHNDHTADLESILTLLHRYNLEIKDSANPTKDNTIRNELAHERRIPPEQVSQDEIERRFLISPRRKVLDLYFPVSVFKKYSGLFELFSRLDYRIHIIEEGTSKFLDGNIELQVIKAKHNDILSDRHSVGFILLIDNLMVVYTGDTGWSEAIEAQYITVAEKYKGRYCLLVAHLGGFKEHERLYLNHGLRHKAFYDNHLGRLGLARITEILRPEVCFISEFGEEFRGNTIKIAQVFREAFEGRTVFLPAGIGLTFDLDRKKIKAVTEVDLTGYRLGFDFIPPDMVGVCELRKSYSLHYFDKSGRVRENELLQVLVENFNRMLSSL